LEPGNHFGARCLFGSLTGALASSVSTWITQRHQDRRDLLAKRIFYREQLYSDFINEGAHAIADAIQHTSSGPEQAHSDLRTFKPHTFKFFNQGACER
jgi:hypothetical protein